MKFQIIKNDQPKARTFFRWRLLDDDGHVIARSCKYETLKACKNGIRCVALSAISVILDSLLAEGNFSLSDLTSPDLLSPDLLPEAPLPDVLFEDL